MGIECDHERLGHLGGHAIDLDEEALDDNSRIANKYD